MPKIKNFNHEEHEEKLAWTEASVSYRNFLYSNEQLIVIARSVVTKQSHKNDSKYD